MGVQQIVNLSNTENPFGTSNGQIMVSQFEHFWANLARRGKLVTGIREGVAITSGNETTFSMLSSYSNRIVIPEKLIVSSNVDITVRVQIVTGIASENFWISGGYFPVGTTFQLDFNGNIKMHNGSDYVGSLNVLVKPLTANGSVWIYNQGWSVDDEQ